MLFSEWFIFFRVMFCKFHVQISKKILFIINFKQTESKNCSTTDLHARKAVKHHLDFSFLGMHTLIPK